MEILIVFSRMPSRVNSLSSCDNSCYGDCCYGFDVVFFTLRVIRRIGCGRRPALVAGRFVEPSMLNGSAGGDFVKLRGETVYRGEHRQHFPTTSQLPTKPLLAI